MVLPCQVYGIADPVPVPDLLIDPALGIQPFQLLFRKASLLLPCPVAQAVILVSGRLSRLVHCFLQAVQRPVHIPVRGLSVLCDAGQVPPLIILIRLPESCLSAPFLPDLRHQLVQGIVAVGCPSCPVFFQDSISEGVIPVPGLPPPVISIVHCPSVQIGDSPALPSLSENKENGYCTNLFYL